VNNYKVHILSLYGYTALWTLTAFSVSYLIHSRKDSLEGGSARRKAATYTQNKRTQTSMPRVGFDSMAPVCERAKTIAVILHTLNFIIIIIIIIIISFNCKWVFIRWQCELYYWYNPKVSNRRYICVITNFLTSKALLGNDCDSFAFIAPVVH
jgi:hypothetical protein